MYPQLEVVHFSFLQERLDTASDVATQFSRIKMSASDFHVALWNIKRTKEISKVLTFLRHVRLCRLRHSSSSPFLVLEL